MWGEVDSHHLNCENIGRQSDQSHGVRSSDGPFMAPSGRGQWIAKGGGELGLGISMFVSTLCSALEIQAKEAGQLAMAGSIPLTREGNHEDCNCSRLGGGKGIGGSGADEDAMQHHGNGGEDLGERWFSLENSPVEILSLTRLEGEMNSSLLSEHGGGQCANPLWVVCILLGRLFHE